MATVVARLGLRLVHMDHKPKRPQIHNNFLFFLPVDWQGFVEVTDIKDWGFGLFARCAVYSVSNFAVLYY